MKLGENNVRSIRDERSGGENRTQQQGEKNKRQRVRGNRDAMINMGLPLYIFEYAVTNYNMR